MRVIATITSQFSEKLKPEDDDHFEEAMRLGRVNDCKVAQKLKHSREGSHYGKLLAYVQYR